MLIRKAAQEDLDAAADLYSAVLAEEESGRASIGWIRGVYPTKLTAETAWKKGQLYVGEEDNAIVASAIINQEQPESYRDGNWQYDVPDDEVMVLHTLAVDPKCSGRGLGKAFVQFYEQYALAHHCMYLRMDTQEKNRRARAMYRKLGYQERNVIPCEFNGIKGVALVLLEKKLADNGDVL